MKFIKFLSASLIGGFIMMVVIPFLLINLNNYLNLPIYSSNITKILGLLFIVTGLVSFYYCSSLFLKYGKGTPLITEPPTKFVEKGLYRYTRNPMYFGHFAIFLGEFFFFGSLLLSLYLLIQVALIHIFVTKYEEPKLRKRYREEYVEYTKRVKRWLFV